MRWPKRWDRRVPSVKSALYRARTTLAKHQPTLQPETMSPQISDEDLSKLLERYVQAWESADVDALVALLRDDCTFSMPPIPSWYRDGRRSASWSLRRFSAGKRTGAGVCCQHLPTRNTVSGCTNWINPAVIMMGMVFKY